MEFFVFADVAYPSSVRTNLIYVIPGGVGTTRVNVYTALREQVLTDSGHDLNQCHIYTLSIERNQLA